ncbi:roquin-2, partial [Aplysia californica]|uniref:RING-type E3 ubiquitin transferase n=1 Tax=Aplysia californica TaxID=6500 RepID=A0ABM1VX45_APLCA
MHLSGLSRTECLTITCPVCIKLFNEKEHRPISLGCGHTVCKSCIKRNLKENRCPFDQIVLPDDVDKLPANFALMHLVGAAVPEQEKEDTTTGSNYPKSYEVARRCIEDMAVHLKPLAENASDDDGSTCSDHSSSRSSSKNNSNNSAVGCTVATKCVLSRPMQRKLISLIHCQLLEEEGRSRSARIARSLGERIVLELLTLHQYPHQLSASLWAAVRTRGCQFLGPAMQEEVLKLILLALEGGAFLSRKVLVLFVVQKLEQQYPQASKTAIGHVVQLLYRASCFKVMKREDESSLMQLKEEFCQYEALRREHDSQIVQIAIEAGLRISPEQWSSLLYGDPAHKSHMQSIIDKHQSPQSFAQSITELMLTLQRNSDVSGLQQLQPQLEFLSSIDPSPECPAPSWENTEAIMRSLDTVISAFVDFLSNPDHRSRLESAPVQNTRYKTSMCRDFSAKGSCPRGNTCTFAHSNEELERYRSRSRRSSTKPGLGLVDKTSSSLTAAESDQLKQVQRLSRLKQEGSTGEAAAPLPTPDGLRDGVQGHPSGSQPWRHHNHSVTLNAQDAAQHQSVAPTPRGLSSLGAGSELRGVAKQLDPDSSPYFPQASITMTSTQLTFTQGTARAPESMRAPTACHQTCFHPHNPGPSPFFTHMPSGCSHLPPGHDPRMTSVQPPPDMGGGQGAGPFYVPVGGVVNPQQRPPTAHPQSQHPSSAGMNPAPMLRPGAPPPPPPP